MESITTASVRTNDDVKRLIAERNATHVKVGIVDMDGILRGKYMAHDKFLASLEGSFGFCNVVLGWDSNDQLYDNVSLTGWHAAYPDTEVRVVPETCRRLPFENDTLFFLSEFAGPSAVAPRPRHTAPGLSS